MLRTVKDVTYELGKTVRYLTEKERHWGSKIAFHSTLSYIELIQNEVGNNFDGAERNHIQGILGSIETFLKENIAKTENSEKNLEENYED